jgi:PhoPQ-activated pathogenicity-related protein
LTDAPRPRFAWNFDDDGSIRVTTETRPAIVKLRQAHDPNARDFRLETIGRAYTSSILEDQGDGLYVGEVPEPKHGWTAYFIELTFSGPAAYPYKFTTGVRVAPDRLPFGPPPEEAGTRSH